MPLRTPAPRRFAVVVLDVLVTATVISSVLAALLSEGSAAVFKARFVNVLSAMSEARATLIERHAESGVWTDAAEQAESREGYTLGTAHGAVTAVGALSGRSFAVTIRPAVAAPLAHWGVLWLCGDAEPPAGWTAAEESAALNMPDEMSLSACSWKAL